jgi:hypothetical protein
MAFRKGIRPRQGGREQSGDASEELVERTRREARAMSRRRARQARRAVRPEQNLGARLRGGTRETGRRLRPVGAPVAGFFAWIGRPVARALLFVVQLFAALISLVLEVGQFAVRWIGAVLMSAALILVEAARRHVTPRSTVAFVGVVAAVGLGVSQFFDYHGVAVDAPDYAGEIGRVTNGPPMTDLKTAGSAHLWLLLPVAAAAVILIMAAYRGRPRLAAGVAACGLVGIAVALAVDLPQGLEVGRAGIAFNGTEAKLLEGFWAEIACSAVLILCGGLLAHYSRGVTGERRRRRQSGGARRRAPHREVGGIYPDLQTER